MSKSSKNASQIASKNRLICCSFFIDFRTKNGDQKRSKIYKNQARNVFESWLHFCTHLGSAFTPSNLKNIAFTCIKQRFLHFVISTFAHSLDTKGFQNRLHNAPKATKNLHRNYDKIDTQMYRFWDPKWPRNGSQIGPKSTPGAITFPYKTFLGTRVASRAHLDLILGIFWATWTSFLLKTTRPSHVCCCNVWENTCVWHSKAVQNAFQIPFYMNKFCRARVACPQFIPQTSKT